MPDIGTLKTVRQGTIHILTVEQGSVRPARAQTAIINWEGEPYEGDYEITPTQETQTVPAANKRMIQDLIIRPIPSNYGLITWNGAALTVS